MLDQWIQTLQAGDCLAERDLKKLCLMVSPNADKAWAPGTPPAEGAVTPPLLFADVPMAFTSYELLLQCPPHRVPVFSYVQ